MDTIASRLRKALSMKRMKQQELVNITGIGKSSISTYLSGEYEPKQRNIYKIAQALNVSEAWLMGYDVPIERKTETIKSTDVTSETVFLPVIGSIAAGYDDLAVQDWDGDSVEIPLSYLHGQPESEFFVLNVEGNSMYPLYMDGDRVVIHKADTLDRSGQIGAVIYDSDYATLKKVEYVPGEDWMKLIPINPEYQPKTIEGADLELCRVIGIPVVLVRNIQQ